MALLRYERMIARETLLAIALVLAAFLALFSFFDLINEMKSVGHGGYTLGYALLFVVLSLPGRTYELAPIAGLIGTLYALSTFARHSEITVLRASGMSTRDLLSLLFKVAAVLAVTTLMIGEAVVPFSERAAQEMRTRAISNVVAQEFRSGLWVKDGHTFVNIHAATADATLEGVRLYEFDDKLQLRSVAEAASGEYTPPDHWLLHDVVRTLLDGDRASVEQLPQLAWKTELTPEIISVLMVAPERMSLYGLVSYLRHLSVNHQKTERYEIALWKKLVYPLAVIVMVALALPFGYTHSRMGGMSLKMFGGVMVGILFHMLNGLFSSLGVINSWPPFASAVAPSALFLLLAAGILWWVERR
jgi:lipopolysaccharide export system permease protein